MYKPKVKDRERKHYAVTKSGEVVRIISRELAIELFKIKADDAPVIYCVWGNRGIDEVQSKTEFYNEGVTFGIFVGMLEDMVLEYNSFFQEND